jgi:maltooligosyltrehalose trehalohydrolase
MGEEYGEIAPFEYFVSHSDPGLIEAVRRGRREEFAAFRWQGVPSDPQDEATFFHAKLNHELRRQGNHQVLLGFYREVIRLRKELPALSRLSLEHMEVEGLERERVLVLRRGSDSEEAGAIFHFGRTEESLNVPLPRGRWHKLLDSAARRWNGPGNAGPESMDSEGEVSLTLPPWSWLLYLKGKETVT